VTLSLNTEQLKAAEALDGPVMINAGAGTGKTRTLTERLVRAVVPDAIAGWLSVDTSEVVAITFTEKAAGELGERVRGTLRDLGRSDLARGVDTAWISTIHSFCSRILHRHALEAGIDPAFTVLRGVRAGTAREKAFEDAARELLQSQQGADLLDGYSYGALYQAVEGVRSAVFAHGLDLSHVVAEEMRRPSDLLSEARSYFTQAHEELQTCELKSVSMSAHAEQCESTSRALFEIPDDADAAQVGALVGRALGNYAQKRGVKAHADLCADIVETRARLASEAAALEAHDSVDAFIQLARLYTVRYSAEKNELSALDFDDLQSLTLQLLNERPEIAEKYRHLFKLVMVDEFQDTDRLQLALIRAVTQENLCTVGDERQSIYRFRGADVHVYRAHNDEMRRRGAREIALTVNYRSHPGVIAFVNQLFGSRELFGPDGLIELHAGRTEPEIPAFGTKEPRCELLLVDQTSSSRGPARHTEADEVATRFKSLLGRFAPSQMVILLRSYRHAAVYAEALQKQGIPALIVGGSRFFGLAEVSYLRALVRLLANPHDDAAFVRFLESPLVGLSPDGLWRLAAGVADNSGSGGMWAAAPSITGLVAADEVALSRACKTLRLARERVGSCGLDEIILRVVEELDYDRYLLGSGDVGRQTYANVLKFARMAAEFDRLERGGPAAFGAHLDASERLGEHESPAALSDDRSPAVRIMSVHASKGLEFPVVAVVELAGGVRGDEGIVRCRREGDLLRVALSVASWDGESVPKSPLFEEISKTSKEEEIEEVKRVLYVACTRAQEFLLLSGSTGLSKPATQEAPIAWIRRAFSLDACAGGVESIINLEAGQTVRVRSVPEAPVEQDVQMLTAETNDLQRAGDIPTPSREVAPALAVDLSPKPHLQHITYSDIGEFETCALKYRATRQWRLGAIDSGAGSGHPLAFGSALHAVLQVVMAGLAQAGERTDQIARYHGLADEDLDRLKHAERAFVQSQLARSIRACDQVVTEAPFAVELCADGGGRFMLTGSIDLLGWAGDRITIVDYKTGVSGEESELAERYRTQARCYALAALSQGAASVELHFVRPEVLADDGEPQKVTFEFHTKDIDELTAYVVDAYRKLDAGVYEPLSVWNERSCGSCPIAGNVCRVSRRT